MQPPKIKSNISNIISFFIEKLNTFSKISIVFRNSKIQTRLVSSFLVLSLLPLTIIGIVSYSKSSSAIKSKINVYSNQVIGQLGTNLGIELSKYLTFLNDMKIDSVSMQPNLTKLLGTDDLIIFRCQQHRYAFEHHLFEPTASLS